MHQQTITLIGHGEKTESIAQKSKSFEDRSNFGQETRPLETSVVARRHPLRTEQPGETQC